MFNDRVLASIVVLSLIAQSVGWAHQDPPAPIKKLNIVIVEGDGAVNNVKQRVAREPIVQVEDENRKPVAGAVVVFTLPNQGAGAVFPNGVRSLTVMTDAQGQAAARGLQSNPVAGQYQIRVTASAQGQTASATIAMTNAAVAGAAAAGGLGLAKWLIILGVAGGAAAGAGVAISNSGGGSTAKPPTVITPGTPSVGAPQ